MASIPPGTHAPCAIGIFSARSSGGGEARLQVSHELYCHGDPNGRDGGVSSGVVVPEYKARVGPEVGLSGDAQGHTE